MPIVQFLFYWDGYSHICTYIIVCPYSFHINSIKNRKIKCHVETSPLSYISSIGKPNDFIKSNFLALKFFTIQLLHLKVFTFKALQFRTLQQVKQQIFTVRLTAYYRIRIKKCSLAVITVMPKYCCCENQYFSFEY